MQSIYRMGWMVSLRVHRQSHLLHLAYLHLVYEQHDIALFAFVVAGAMLGFLVFNIKPAKVFMGDTGSFGT